MEVFSDLIKAAKDLKNSLWMLVNGGKIVEENYPPDSLLGEANKAIKKAELFFPPTENLR